MARRENPKNKFTTISIRKSDKQLLRRFAKKDKETKNGVVYEKDADIFSRILSDYIAKHRDEIGNPNPTYPNSI